MFHGESGEIIDPALVSVYRGGRDLQVKPGDIKVGKDGLLQTTHGLSLDTDSARLAGFGGAYRVKSIPAELQIVQRGVRDTHFEVVPRQPMTPQRYEELVQQIILE
jgi:hypothetical protein